MKKTPRNYVTNPCGTNDHDTRVSASTCGVCGVDLCDICGTDEHFTSDGHDLSNPRYWGV